MCLFHEKKKRCPSVCLLIPYYKTQNKKTSKMHDKNKYMAFLSINFYKKQKVS